MSYEAAGAVWLVFAAYAGVGLIVGLWLLLGGLKRVDTLGAAAPLRVKLLILPGLIALWPLMLRRLAGARPREDRQ